MKLNRLIQISAFMAVFFAFIACDENYSNIGGEIINNPTDVKLSEYEVNAYSQKINSIQTNNLTNYVLGTFKDPVYGESSASIVTQLALEQTNPDLGDNVALDSVVLTIPYYSTETANSTEEKPEFTLDSIFGEGSFKLSVYETSYFLNDLDPDSGFENSQKYYSDQQPVIEQNIVGDPLYENENFKPSAEAYDSYEVVDGELDTVSNAPALRIKLPIAFFKEKIIDNLGTDIVANNSNFKNYLRSIFIKAESNGSEGTEALLDFTNNKAKVSLYYQSDVQDFDDNGEEVTVRKNNSFDLLMVGMNHFNTFSGEFPEEILQDINSQSADSDGSENLYLKGQEGSMIVVNLFPDESVLASLKEQNLLINEANLTFYVNQDQLAGGIEPERVLLFDLDNRTVISDYINDPSVSEVNPLNSRLTFAPRLERGEDEKGVYYKIRITRHLSDVLSGDYDNVRLGLVVTGNINTTGNSAVRGIENVKAVPKSELFTPYGTVLFGDEAANDEKRLKLRIYYTDYN